jgi:type IV secretion system protein VirB2
MLRECSEYAKQSLTDYGSLDAGIRSPTAFRKPSGRFPPSPDGLIQGVIIMFTKSIFSARNPVAALGYALLAYGTTEVAMATSGVKEDKSGLQVISVFLNNISTILNAASIVVVTIAIVFAGYQIAFNNKRISEVAPVLLGGVLVGGAAQIANMLVSASKVGTVSAT